MFERVRLAYSTDASNREAMYLTAFHAENLKCFAAASLEFPANEDGTRGGWNVLLGVNGTGKSTLLQAMALTLVGPTIGSELLRLGERDKWIRRGHDMAILDARIGLSDRDTIVKGRRRVKPYPTRLYVSGSQPTQVEGVDLRQPTLVVSPKLRRSLEAGPYSGAGGWFSAGYGPFRRLSGGGLEEDQRLAWQGGPAGRHVSLFRESAALSRCEPWLRDLHNMANDKSLPKEAREKATRRLSAARLLVDSLLPQGMRFGKITSQEVNFINASGLAVELGQLSDGFRSFLSLAIDLLQQIIDADEWGQIKGSATDACHIDTEGVVFIDEADTHLHPSWQRELGMRMCQVFPKIQFIVSTHSPFVAQAAHPGCLFVVRTEADGQATVTREEESVLGWTADQILLSPLFGLASTRDPDTDALMRRRQTLLGQRARNSAQVAELAKISAKLTKRLTAPGDTLGEHDMDRAIKEHARRRGEAPP